MDVQLEDGKVIRLQATTKIEGIVVPSWFAVMVGALFLAALFVIALMFNRIGDVHQQDAERGKIIEREIRLLQLHAQAVQNTLIQNGRAKLEDFPPLESPPKK